jgi:hypothetical protein
MCRIRGERIGAGDGAPCSGLSKRRRDLLFGSSLLRAIPERSERD